MQLRYGSAMIDGSWPWFVQSSQQRLLIGLDQKGTRV